MKYTIEFNNDLFPVRTTVDINDITTSKPPTSGNPSVLSTEDKVLQMIQDKLTNPNLIPYLNLNSRLGEDLDFDSLEMCEFIMDIENEFDISIPDEDWQRYFNQSISDICDYINSRL